MNKALLFTLTLAAAAACVSGPAIAPARAADDAMAKIDCTQAEAMYSDAVKSRVGDLTGDVDKDFAMLVMYHEKATAGIMKVEAQCGKDPKMKAMAQKQTGDEDARMQMFRNMNMSQ